MATRYHSFVGTNATEADIADNAAAFPTLWPEYVKSKARNMR